MAEPEGTKNAAERLTAGASLSNPVLLSVMRLILPVLAFVLWVIEADRPPFKRATFPTFPDCVAAGQAQIESLRRLSPAIRWECWPE
jgi:hypothetical protein